METKRQNKRNLVAITIAPFLALILSTYAALGQIPITSLPYTIEVTGTYVLNSDLMASSPGSSISVLADNVVLDGQGHSLNGNGISSRGIEVISSNVVIRSFGGISGFINEGIRFQSGNTGVVESCTISGNRRGIYIRFFDKVDVTANTISSNLLDGIYVVSSPSCTLEDNNVEYNNRFGISLINSTAARLRGNAMSGNMYNLNVTGRYEHDIDTTNTLDGKPVYFLYGLSGVTVDAPNAGAIYCIDCDGLAIEDHAFANTGQALVLINTHNLTVRNVEVDNCFQGILSNGSNGNTITDNSISNCRTSIQIVNSDDNTLERNSVSNGLGYAIHLRRTDGSIIRSNVLEANYYAILDIGSVNNILVDNVVDGSMWGFNLRSADNYLVQGNKITGAAPAILVSSCVNSVVADNDCKDGGGIVLERSSNYNTVSNNKIKDGAFNPSWPQSSSGIYLWLGSNGNVLDNNEIKKMQADGLLLEDADNNVVSSNKIESNAGAGIRQDSYSTGNTFSDNKVKDNTGGDFIGI